MRVCHTAFYTCLQTIKEPMKPTNMLTRWCDIVEANQVSNLLHELDSKTTARHFYNLCMVRK